MSDTSALEAGPVSPGPRMAIAFAGDEAFLPRLGTAVISLLENRSAVYGIDLFLLTKDVSEENAALLREACESRSATLTVVPVPRDAFAGMSGQGRYTDVNYFRLLLPELLDARVERVLYLDGDVVVLGPLDALWETDLGGRPAGAVKDAVVPHEMLGLPPGESALNSGVLLIDTRQWRAAGITERARAFLDSPELSAGIRFADQDVLSVVLRGQWHELPATYNSQAAVFMRPRGVLTLDDNEFAAARGAPTVVHYSMHRKPWHYLCAHPLRRLYWQYARRGPWRRQPMEGITVRNVVRRVARAWLGVARGRNRA